MPLTLVEIQVKQWVLGNDYVNTLENTQNGIIECSYLSSSPRKVKLLCYVVWLAASKDSAFL